MPQMEETSSSLHIIRPISLINLRLSYRQLPIAEQDRHKTAFSVNGQRYELLGRQFRLCDAPATFRSLLLMVLKRLQAVVVYGDDIIIFSETDHEHFSPLVAVLQRLEEVGLKLSHEMSQIFQKVIMCLDHIVGNDQLQPLPEKSKANQEFHSPEIETSDPVIPWSGS
ncbi:unnamed protein product, partial [Dicrocoelium dendriticum]